jgi:hypothetical protein
MSKFDFKDFGGKKVILIQELPEVQIGLTN